MHKGYMFFDAETANSAQRICQLAYVLIDFEGNQIGDPVAQLIDPECEFDTRNVRVHHITGDDVAEMPNIAEFCEGSDFIQLLEEYIFVAHNAKQADRHYLYKSLSAYGIEMPVISLIDTMQVASSCLSFSRLLDVCAHYGVIIEKHHDALSDALACKDIFFRLAAEYEIPEPIEWTPGTKSSNGSYTARPIDGLGFTNGTHQPIEEVLDEFEAVGLKWGPNDINDVNGLRIVVTGTVPGYPGESIENELKKLGARPSHKVGDKTQVISIGHNAGMKKINPARERGLPIMAVADLLEVIDR